MQDLLTHLDSGVGLAALAIIAFCDTLIGVGFFVFGEVAFLSAGAAYTAHGYILPVIVVLVFAWCGDATSYFLGKKYGAKLSIWYLTKQKRRLAWRRAKNALAKRGAAFVVLSRLLGPVAWITPFLAGTLDMPKRSFLPAAALGVVLGGGQFLILGAIGTGLLGLVIPFVSDHLATFVLGVLILIPAVVLWRRSTRSFLAKIFSVTALSVGIFLSANFSYFFIFNSHSYAGASRPFFQNLCDATHGPFTVYPGPTDLHRSQAINVILISDRSADELMFDLGWQRNLTFSHDDIGFWTYAASVFRNAPPISELYLNGVPADSAHQLPGTLQEREHIRWWKMGRNVYFGALSRTEEIAIKYYKHLPALLHDIDPEIDESRDQFALAIEADPNYTTLGLAPLAVSPPDGSPAEYVTDGRVLVVAHSKSSQVAEAQNCLAAAIGPA